MITVLHFMRGGGVAPNDYNWLHRGGEVWKKPKIYYIIYEQPLISPFSNENNLSIIPFYVKHT